jgi:hypothetical protein
MVGTAFSAGTGTAATPSTSYAARAHPTPQDAFVTFDVDADQLLSNDHAHYCASDRHVSPIALCRRRPKRPRPLARSNVDRGSGTTRTATSLPSPPA